MALGAAFRRLLPRPGPGLTALLVLALGSGVCIPFLTLVSAGLSYSRSSKDPVGIVSAGPINSTGLWSAAGQTIADEQMEHLEVLLWTLGAATLLVLAIVSINLIILILSRATARREEMALRAALGAGRLRILGQLFSEGALLAIGGAITGWLIGLAGLQAIRSTWPDGLRMWVAGRPDAGVIAIALGIPVLAVLIASIVPARGASRRDLYHSLPGVRSSAGRGERTLRNAMVIAAVASSMTLLVGAGLLVRSFASAHAGEGADAGIEDGLVVNIPLVESGPAPERTAAIHSMLQQVREIPGVRAESIASTGSILGLGPLDDVRAVCDFCSRSVGLLFVIDDFTRHHSVTPGFFESLGLEMIRGRDFTSADGPTAPRVAIVSRTFGYRIFPRGDPIGKQVRVGGPDGDWVTVIGIAPDVRNRGIGTGAEPVPSLYLSALQYPPASAVLTLRTEGEPSLYEAAVTAAVGRTGRAPPAMSSTLQRRLELYRSPLLWLSWIFATLAAITVILAVVGLHGVISYQVRQRTREVGIRMALGAQPRSVVRLIVGESLRLTTTGAYLGLMGAFTLARLLQILVLGVRPLDPITYGAVILLLATVATVASLVPAREAARTDPLVALRYD
ncbi:MAG TPA: FtsX-like permease family protein [Longimicrobiaceae bacterium]|nr:FtsX-like permease family protein [Longimicrobiaceae bacterium]